VGDPLPPLIPDPESLPDLDVSGWARDELRRLQQQREDAYGGWRSILPWGRGKREQAQQQADAAVDAHLLAFGDQLGMPRQWVTGRPDDAPSLPVGVAVMPPGLSGRAAAEWRSQRLEETMVPPRVAVDDQGVVRSPDGEPVVGAGGARVAGVRMAGNEAAGTRAPVYAGAMQWQDANGILRDERGRALPMEKIDRSQLSGETLSAYDSYTSPADVPLIGQGTPEQADWIKRQKMEAEADALETAAAKATARREEGLRVDARQVFDEAGAHPGDYMPLLPVSKILRLVEVNRAAKKLKAREEWEQGESRAEAQRRGGEEASQIGADGEENLAQRRRGAEGGTEPPALTRHEEETLKAFLADRALVNEVGSTVTAKGGEILLNMVPFALELAATGGTATATRKGVEAGVRKAVERVAGEQATAAATRFVTQNLLGRFARGAVGVGTRAAARTALTPGTAAAD
jgi:hypothetical protein